MSGRECQASLKRILTELQTWCTKDSQLKKKKNQWALKQHIFILENSIIGHLAHKIHLCWPACEQNCKLKETGDWLKGYKQ